MKTLLLAAFGILMMDCHADTQPLVSVGAVSKRGVRDHREVFLPRQPLVSVGAVSKRGLLDGAEFDSCAVSPFLNDYRIYLCYRKRIDGDLVIGERVLGSDEPVNEKDPERVISRMVFAMEDSFDQSKTLFFEFPKEAFRDLTFPHLGPVFDGGRTHLAIVLQSEILTVFMSGGDGAGSYKVNWIIDAKECRMRRLESVGEGDEVTKTGPWLDLKKIPTAKVEFQIKK